MLSLAIGISGSVYLLAAARGARQVMFVLKPGTMLLIIALAWIGARSGRTGAYADWIVAALAASIVGDIFLMWANRWFVQGLAAFLVAHLFYIGALWTAMPGPLAAADLVTGLILVLFVLAMRRRLVNGMLEQGQEKLIAPVTVYLSVIAVMVWRSVGLLFGPDPAHVRGWLVALGGVLFMLSDSFLGWDRFVRPVPRRDLLVMSTYFAAQYCFALSTGW